MPVLEIDYGTGADGDAVVSGDATIGSRNYRSFTQTGGALTILSGSVVKAQSAIRLLGGYVWVQQVGGPPGGYGAGSPGGGAALSNSGGGGGGGAGHNGPGAPGGGGGGPYPGGGGGNAGTYDSVGDQGLNDAPDAYFVGASGGAGGLGYGGGVGLGNGSHGAATAGPGWDFSNGVWQFSSLVINTGAVFSGVSEIYVQGDCTIAGDFVGTGRGHGGGSGSYTQDTGVFVGDWGHNNVPDGTRTQSGAGPAPGTGAQGFWLPGGSGGATSGGGGGGHVGAGGTGAGAWYPNYVTPGAGGGAYDGAGSWPLRAGSGGGAGGWFARDAGGPPRTTTGGGDGGAGGASITIRCNRLLGGGRIITDGNPGNPGKIDVTLGYAGFGTGAGGGGAGGSVRIEANTMQCAVGVYARGGPGGAGTDIGDVSWNPSGGGGGGGAGSIYVYYGINWGFVTPNDGNAVTGGAGGWTDPMKGHVSGSPGNGGQVGNQNFGVPSVGGGAGGPGGGTIKLVAPTVEIGTGIHAYGGAGAGGGSSGGGGGGGGGGGSGGAVWVVATIIRGAGAVHVPGSAGGAGGTNAGAGGASAPGRIRFDCANNEYTGYLSVGVDQRQLRVRGAPILIG